MENNLNMGREFNWDDVIEHDSEGFELLPEGDYDFTVTGFERARHNGSAKVPACNKAVIKIEVRSADGKRGVITHNLLLHSNCEGLLCAFFTGIGQRRHGEKLQMNWSKVVGSRGRCKVGVRSYTNVQGEVRQSNEIKRFYDPAEAQQAAPAQPQQSAQQQTFGGFTGGFSGGFAGGR